MWNVMSAVETRLTLSAATGRCSAIGVFVTGTLSPGNTPLSSLLYRMVHSAQWPHSEQNYDFNWYRIVLLANTHTHTRLTALFPGLCGWAGTRKVKPIWILMKQEIVSSSGNRWAICQFAPRSRQITMPAPHHSVFYRPDALPAAQPKASKNWRLDSC